MARQVDVVIIGAGSAGLSAMSEVRKKTDNFILVNQGPYGTSCARVACMPTKALIEAARACHGRHFLKHLGVQGTESLTIDRPRILAHVRRLRDGFTSGMINSTAKLGDKLITGPARFIDPGTIEVAGRVYKTAKTVIATGSRSIVPSAWHRLGNRVITTEEIFELTDLPDTLAVIGLGPAGLEMAQALARLGVKVTGVEQGAMVGGLSDPEVAAGMVDILRAEMAVHTGMTADLEPAGSELEVGLGKEKIRVAKVLATMGRRPNLEDMGLENLGLDGEAGGRLPHDPATMQLGDLPVFIAGDANGDRPLLHEAIDEGRIAGFNAVSDQLARFRRRTPLAITFVEPNIVTVGQRYEEISNLDDCVIGGHDFSSQARARMSNSNQGLIRLYARRSDGLVLGAEMAIPAAEHVGHLLALAIQQKTTINELLRLPFYHPVIEEGIQAALRGLSKQTDQGKVSDTELLLCGSHVDDCLS